MIIIREKKVWQIAQRLLSRNLPTRKNIITLIGKSSLVKIKIIKLLEKPFELTKKA